MSGRPSFCANLQFGRDLTLPKHIQWLSSQTSLCLWVICNCILHCQAAQKDSPHSYLLACMPSHARCLPQGRARIRHVLTVPSWSSHPFLSHSGLSFPLPVMTILFLLLGGIQTSLLGYSFLFTFIGSAGCIMGSLYILAKIHLSVSIYHVCP